MPGRVEGKTAIVTGAGSSGPGVGVGKATSILLAEEGACVLLVDRVEDRARETLAAIEAAGGKAAVLVVDLTERSSYTRVVEEARSRFGRVDILVNNAALAALAHLLDTTDDLYDRVMAINLTAPFMLTRAAIPVMVEHGGGSIVNITSIAAFRGVGAGEAAYATSKAALFGMMTDVACAYGHQGIRINCVSPGHVATPLRDAAARDLGIDSSTIDMGHRTALGFEGDAWDVARAALFLASDEARYITGVHIPVDGGTSLRTP